MKRCITCNWWMVSATKPFDRLGYCIRPHVIDRTVAELIEPGYDCEYYEVYVVGPNDNGLLDLGKQYLMALIGRERAEVGSHAHAEFCNDVGRLYPQLSPQLQLNVHDAFRVFLETPNLRSSDNEIS